MSDAYGLIQRFFNPTKYWRAQYNHERTLRRAAEAREAEAVHINEIRLNTILSHERANAEMRNLLSKAYALIGKLEGELAETKKQLAPFKAIRARDAKGHYTSDVVMPCQ